MAEHPLIPGKETAWHTSACSMRWRGSYHSCRCSCPCQCNSCKQGLIVIWQSIVDPQWVLWHCHGWSCMHLLQPHFTIVPPSLALQSKFLVLVEMWDGFMYIKLLIWWFLFPLSIFPFKTWCQLGNLVSLWWTLTGKKTYTSTSIFVSHCLQILWPSLYTAD